MQRDREDSFQIAYLFGVMGYANHFNRNSLHFTSTETSRSYHRRSHEHQHRHQATQVSEPRSLDSGIDDFNLLYEFAQSAMRAAPRRKATLQLKATSHVLQKTVYYNSTPTRMTTSNLNNFNYSLANTTYSLLQATRRSESQIQLHMQKRTQQQRAHRLDSWWLYD